MNHHKNVLYCQLYVYATPELFFLHVYQSTVYTNSTYEYLRIPSNLDVHMMTLLSALPEAKRFPSLL